MCVCIEVVVPLGLSLAVMFKLPLRESDQPLCLLVPTLNIFTAQPRRAEGAAVLLLALTLLT